MQYKTLGWRGIAGMVFAVAVAAGCARYVNPDITDPREARARLAADKSLCHSLANETVPPSYGEARFSPDPTIEGQTVQYLGNVLEDDAHDNVYARCLRDRGWRLAN